MVAQRYQFVSVLVASLFLWCSDAAEPVISADGCGKTKGCWFEPQNCQNDNVTNCGYAVTWEHETDGLAIELGAKISGWGESYYGRYIALAFSYDDKMGDDSVVECVANPQGQVYSYVSFNDGTHNQRLWQASSIMLSKQVNVGSVVDGFLSCKLKRHYAPDSNVPEIERNQVFDLSKNRWTLQMAKGQAIPQTGLTLMIHWTLDGELFPYVSNQKIAVTDTTVITSSKHYDILRSIQYKLVKAHGVLMLIGWWLLASFAILLSRFFKPMWPNHKLLGLKIWYQLHRDLMIAAVIIICVSFGLVYIQAGDFKFCTQTCDDHDYALAAHTAIGIAATAMALIQPFFAWARPFMKRTVFTVIHWMLGMGGWIAATITIFLSCVLGKAHLRYSWHYIPDWIMAGYVSTFILAIVVLEILVKYCEHSGPVRKEEVHMDLLNGPSTETAKIAKDIKQPKTALLRTIVLAIYGVISLGLVIALCVLICIA